MAYHGVGRDRGFTQVLYALYVICDDCGAGDIGNHFDDGLRPWPSKEPDTGQP